MPVNNKPMDDVPITPLVRVCRLLNKHGARYLVVGGYACILHGLVRTTEDVDLLIEESAENYQRVIDALSELEDHAARELTPQDFVENVVVKVADEVEVDISRRAGKVAYTEAAPRARVMDLAGVQVPDPDAPNLKPTLPVETHVKRFIIHCTSDRTRFHPGRRAPRQVGRAV